MRLPLFWLIFLVSIGSEVVSQTVDNRDVVINEILFNPPKGGFDYIELYNRSNKTIDLKELQIAKRNVTGDITGMKLLTRTTTLLGSGHYAVITGNEKWLRQQFEVGDDAVICMVSSMPTFPDDEGSVVITGVDTTIIIDELHYSDKWQFALIADPSGVALERISTDMDTQDSNNWTSASSSSGFGTPGYKNTQSSLSVSGEKQMSIEPALFSPDNDGQDDYARIKFNMDEPGYMANLTIYDLAGKRVRYLLKNEYLGSSAQYKWDGLDDNSRALPQGIYLLCAEVFNLKGKTKRFKKMITLARRL
ncbi:MAG: lamin tail domain-containing protein [Flavitalea sp.]